jgi:arsenate reductase-like glutaredoxin family protein
VDLVNSRSTAFKEAKADLAALTDETAAGLITGNPRIMFRPILTNGKQAAVGFNKEKMEAVLAGR